MSELKATVLIDNIAQNALLGEWGLAVYIEYGGRKILLDTGASGKFIKNAEALKINPGDIDMGILSHAHYDHSDGMASFFEKNTKAKFYLRDVCRENCYGSRFIFSKYIGIKRGTLEKYAHRIEYVTGDREIFDGVYLLPHKTEGLAAAGKKAGMFRKEKGRRVDDDFCHEQNLVIKTSKGLVIFSSCSHGGADNIIRETQKSFPGEKIYAILGGFHLFRSSDEETDALARNIKATGIEKVMTGHCTGDKAYKRMKDSLGDMVTQIYSGFVFEV